MAFEVEYGSFHDIVLLIEDGTFNPEPKQSFPKYIALC